MKWGIVLILVVGGLAWGWRVEQNAQISAKDFCDTVAIGSSFAEVAETARAIGEDRLRLIQEDSIIIGFTGIPPFSRHICDVRGKQGNVVSRAYIYLD